MDLKGKTALLTGGARIGQAVALALGRRGCRVVLAYRRSQGSAEDTVARIKEAGSDGMALKVDVTQKNQLASMVSRVIRRFGGVDILVNMASYYEKMAPGALFQASTRGTAFERNMAVDLRSAYELSLLCVPHMKKARAGRIINFCDWVAASGRPRYKGFVPYYTAKAGLKGLTEALALELAPQVLVNAIAPGPILPPAGLSTQSNKEVIQNTPLGRWGGPEEIAKAVLFFVESDFVTGETLRVDGGRHLY